MCDKIRLNEASDKGSKRELPEAFVVRCVVKNIPTPPSPAHTP